jgi:eukaryotic-like serine/threonine-protein kinase
MGEVYKARDLRLGRAVAIKVLPPEVAADPIARERFDREARAISHINHPHICTLYDIGEEPAVATASGLPVSYFVMELLDGETLAQRLTRGALPIDQALAFGVQIADALDKAHRGGVVHGDLKPENIMVTKSGVKLLDFGLAQQRPVPGATGAADVTASTAAVGTPGIVIGTLQYLAPEQLEGAAADARTDIFAVGAVLYEMVTGHKAFDGHTPATVIAAIMQHQPPPVAVGTAALSAALNHVISLCVAKDPDERWQHAGDVRRQLRWVTEVAASAEAQPVAPKNRRPWLWAAAAALLLIVAAALAIWAYQQRRAEPALVTRTSILLPEGLRFPGVGAIGGVSRFALSPDGRRLAFAATDSAGNLMLWVRPLDALKATPLDGTNGASSPFWSPDSQRIAFVAQGQLKVIGLDGGAPVVLATTAASTTGAWSRDDVILFTPTLTSPLNQVPAAGGTPRPVTTVDKKAGDLLHRNPSFLPDGRHFLYVAAGSRGGGTIGPRAVFVGSLDQSDPGRLVMESGTIATYAQGHLVFVRENMLLAQPFDAERLMLTGEPRPIAEQVELIGPGSAAFTISNTGVLAYEPAGEGSQLVWFDRGGRQLSPVGGVGAYGDLEMSPDGRRAAVSVLDVATNTRDIWVFDIERGVRTRMTLDPNDDVAPVWSADGASIVFASNRKGHFDLYRKAASGVGVDEVLLADATEKIPASWSRDGHAILYSAFDALTSTARLLFFDPETKSTPTTFLASPASLGKLSPDGRWVAYYSGESGRSEVYVVTFPVASRRWQVSTAGGILPRWRHDGRELFYVSRDNRLVAVSVEPGEQDLNIDAPRDLFEARPVGPRSFYDVAGDGARFLVNAVRGESASPSIIVVQNWAAALKP